MCQQAAINRDKHSPKPDIYKFHPFAKRPKPKARQATPEDLQRLFGPDWKKYV